MPNVVKNRNAHVVQFVGVNKDDQPIIVPTPKYCPTRRATLKLNAISFNPNAAVVCVNQVLLSRGVFTRCRRANGCRARRTILTQLLKYRNINEHENDLKILWSKDILLGPAADRADRFDALGTERKDNTLLPRRIASFCRRVMPQR